MNPIDGQLTRLFKAASLAPKAATGGAVFTLEARVLGQWRNSSRADGGEILVVWFRRAAICAGCIALMSLLWNYHDLTGGAGDELAAADSAMRIGVTP
jgi:hypothetical protein